MSRLLYKNLRTSGLNLLFFCLGAVFLMQGSDFQNHAYDKDMIADDDLLYGYGFQSLKTTNKVDGIWIKMRSAM